MPYILTLSFVLSGFADVKCKVKVKQSEIHIIHVYLNHGAQPWKIGRPPYTSKVFRFILIVFKLFSVCQNTESMFCFVHEQFSFHFCR